jgi:hypothetical protein
VAEWTAKFPEQRTAWLAALDEIERFEAITLNRSNDVFDLIEDIDDRASVAPVNLNSTHAWVEFFRAIHRTVGTLNAAITAFQNLQDAWRNLMCVLTGEAAQARLEYMLTRSPLGNWKEPILGWMRAVSTMISHSRELPGLL